MSAQAALSTPEDEVSALVQQVSEGWQSVKVQMSGAGQSTRAACREGAGHATVTGAAGEGGLRLALCP